MSSKVQCRDETEVAPHIEQDELGSYGMQQSLLSLRPYSRSFCYEGSSRRFSTSSKASHERHALWLYSNRRMQPTLRISVAAVSTG